MSERVLDKGGKNEFCFTSFTFICSINSHVEGIEALEMDMPIWEGDEEGEENGTIRTLRRFYIKKYKQGEKTGKRKGQREGMYPSV